MKIGYGYKRQPQGFRAYEVGHIWGDKTPERPELAALMGAGGLEPAIHGGETLVLLHHADIGDDWRQRKRVLSWMAERGVMIQVRDQAPVLYDSEEKLNAYKDQNGGDRTQKDPGRPQRIKWTVDTAKAFGAVWYGPYSRGYVASEFERMTKKRFDQKAVNNCNYFFGPRDGSRKGKFNIFTEEAE
jgi:hypothetical protein